MPCTIRPPGQLSMAGKVIGSSLHLAIDSAIRLERMKHSGRYPVAPHKPGFDQDAWSLLQTMLIEERRLIEFIRGPATIMSKGRSSLAIRTTYVRTASPQAWRQDGWLHQQR